MCFAVLPRRHLGRARSNPIPHGPPRQRATARTKGSRTGSSKFAQGVRKVVLREAFSNPNTPLAILFRTDKDVLTKEVSPASHRRRSDGRNGPTAQTTSSARPNWPSSSSCTTSACPRTSLLASTGPTGTRSPDIYVAPVSGCDHNARCHQSSSTEPHDFTRVAPHSLPLAGSSERVRQLSVRRSRTPACCYAIPTAGRGN